MENQPYMVLIKNYLFPWKTVKIFRFYEQKYVEKVYLKVNLAQSTKQESPWFSSIDIAVEDSESIALTFQLFLHTISNALNPVIIIKTKHHH